MRSQSRTCEDLASRRTNLLRCGGLLFLPETWSLACAPRIPQGLPQKEEIKAVSILGATHQKVTWSQESHQPLDSPHPEAALPVRRKGLDAAPLAPISSTIRMTCVWFSSHVTEESGPV